MTDGELFDSLQDDKNDLLDAMREIYEIYAGSEGISPSINSRERYLLGLIQGMADIAGQCLADARDNKDKK